MSATPLAERLRGRAKFLPYGELDRALMIEAAEILSAPVESMTADSVIEWLRDQDIKLVPWQLKRLGMDV